MTEQSQQDDLHPERLPRKPIRNVAGFRLPWVSSLAVAIGLASGIVAFLLYKLIGLFTNLFFFHKFSFLFRSPGAHHLGLWVIALPAAGGLVVGLMAKYGSPKIRGHGIPEAMEAVLISRSRVEPKVAILKPLSAALAIGTGGPFGAEGPIIQTGGALGSIVGQLVRMTAAERKVLLACGAGAGMAATFNTPISGVIIAIELLLFEFKSRSFIPLVIATTLATTIRHQLMGSRAMFEVGLVDFGIPRALPYYLLLGVVCGIAAIGFTKLLFWTEDQFLRLPLDQMWWPAIGGLGLGVIGYFQPRVFGVGYDTISDILTGGLTLKLLVVLMICKAVALVVSLGSGTSGGLLAPMFFSAAAMGAVFADCVNQWIPGAHLSAGAFAIVAMGAVFGAAARAPFTFIIFAFEITRDYNSVLPLMLVGVISSGIALRFLRESIMTEKLARRGLRVQQEYEADILQEVNVGDVMLRKLQTVPATMPLTEFSDYIAKNDPRFTAHHSTFIIDSENRLVGIIARGDVLRVLEQEPATAKTVLEAGTRELVVTHPDETVYIAVTKMLANDVASLPVVKRGAPHEVIGYFGRRQVMAARMRQFDEEYDMEPGWLSRPRRTP
ncbi:MAG TPA: chloride channel protein [Verrucomicrobiae bacterium]|nr:chloride channel protein [Verrucomicrobiae bacterium]